MVLRRSIQFLAATLLGITLITANAQTNNKLPPAATDNDFHDNGQPLAAKVQLGKFLFFDKILSGNKNIACATCHHGLTDTGDGLSLPIGEGGRGLSITRDTGPGTNAVVERVPRNAPPVFALGAKTMTIMFHDGRVEVDASQPSGFSTPAGNDLPTTLENVLAAQAMFPVTSATEMAGQPGENTIADAATIVDIWNLLANRLRNIPEYVELFEAAFGIDQGDITFAHAANAISAFERAAWRADNNAFDRYLRGDKKALSKSAEKGMKLFYGDAGCSSCHSGTFQTDMDFHAIAMPQIGQGKGHGVDGNEDFGREAITGNADDRFKFRTPPLRNVALTGPWGHDGAYNTLEGIVRHHLNPEESILLYNCDIEPKLPSRADLDALDCEVMNTPAKVAAIISANELDENKLSDKNFGYLIDFLHALTDPSSIDLRNDMPMRVPSGLNTF